MIAIARQRLVLRVEDPAVVRALLRDLSFEMPDTRRKGELESCRTQAVESAGTRIDQTRRQVWNDLSRQVAPAVAVEIGLVRSPRCSGAAV